MFTRASQVLLICFDFFSVKNLDEYVFVITCRNIGVTVMGWYFNISKFLADHFGIICNSISDSFQALLITWNLLVVIVGCNE